MVLQSHMMGTATVIGLSAGKRLLASSHHYSDVAEKLSTTYVNEVGFPHCPPPPPKNIISAKKPSSNYTPSSNRSIQSMKALKEHVESASAPSTQDPDVEMEEDEEYLVEAFLLLQKSMLEKQWNLSFDGKKEEDEQNVGKRAGRQRRGVTSSGTSARQRRMSTRKRIMIDKSGGAQGVRALMGFENRMKGYVKGVVSEQLLTHPQVVLLSHKIQAGLLVEDHKSRYAAVSPPPFLANFRLLLFLLFLFLGNIYSF